MTQEQYGHDADVAGVSEMETHLTELIAIGASVAGHCQPCLTFHVSRARELGVREDLILKAITVGQMVERGAMSAMDAFARGTIGAAATAASAPGGGACCPGGTSQGGGRCC